MNPLFKLLLGGLATVFAINLFKEEEHQISGIKKDHIYNEFLRSAKRNDDLSNLKRTITRDLERIILRHEEFKVGKTGGSRKRANAYAGYSKMYLLVESRGALLIEELEEYYNEKYLSHRKNKNINKGSASIMTSKDGKYFLYCVVN